APQPGRLAARTAGRPAVDHGSVDPVDRRAGGELCPGPACDAGGSGCDAQAAVAGNNKRYGNIATGGRARVAPQVGARLQGQTREPGPPADLSWSYFGPAGPSRGATLGKGRDGVWLGRREGANRSVAGCLCAARVRFRARPRTTPDAPYRPAPLHFRCGYWLAWGIWVIFPFSASRIEMRFAVRVRPVRRSTFTLFWM